MTATDAAIERELASARGHAEANRRGRLLGQLEDAWAAVPHLRLGELVACAAWLTSRDRDPGQVGDDDLLAAVAELSEVQAPT